MPQTKLSHERSRYLCMLAAGDTKLEVGFALMQGGGQAGLRACETPAPGAVHTAWAGTAATTNHPPMAFCWRGALAWLAPLGGPARAAPLRRPVTTTTLTSTAAHHQPKQTPLPPQVREEGLRGLRLSGAQVQQKAAAGGPSASTGPAPADVYPPLPALLKYVHSQQPR